MKSCLIRYFGTKVVVFGKTTEEQLIKYLNKQDDEENKITSLLLSLICAKISLAKVCWGHRMNLCGEDGDVWKLLND